MTQTPPSARSPHWVTLASMVTLARWRVRRTWGLLLLAGIGIIAAVALVCTVPVYSEVAQTAGLRGMLTATPQSAEMTLQANSNLLSPPIVAENYKNLNRVMQQQLGTYLQPTPPSFFMLTPYLNIAAPASDKEYSISFYGASMPGAARHITLARGRLPAPTSAHLEIAITQQTATFLKIDVGSMLTADFSFLAVSHPLIVPVPVQVVGIIASNPNDPFWHGEDFDSKPGPRGEPPSIYNALMSNDTFLAQMQQIAASQGFPDGITFMPDEEPTLYWYYRLNVAAIGVTQLDDLIERVQTAQAQIANDTGNSDVSSPQLSGAVFDTAQGPGTLERFKSRLSVVNIPVTLLLLQVVGLILFFVGVMTSLLVERQAEVITLLRSRGASRRQVFGAFVTQSVWLALAALLVGPLLALLMTNLLVRATFSAADQQALNSLTEHPLPTVLAVGAYALVAALCAVGAMALAIWRSASRDVLEMRRQAARATRQPLWQRLYLDVAAVIIALTGFSLSLYVSNSGALDARTVVVIATPLALVAPIFLVIAGLLLFLRAYPLLLRRIARITSRRPEAAPMLALAQIARAPGQAVRMILLLALASSFASFALVFITSEAQHLQAFASYEAGADFSGPPVTKSDATTLAKQTAAYRAIAGVISATLGFTTDDAVASSRYPVSVRAVDATNYAQTAIWTTQDSSQSLASLMSLLVSERSQGIGTEIIPAIVDQLTWQRLHLNTGTIFNLQMAADYFNFRAVAEVEHIPTVEDSLVAPDSSDFTAPGGILVDYQTLASVNYVITGGVDLSVNYVWLRTSDAPALLKGIRDALTSGPLTLSPLHDRRAGLSALEQDPLYLALQEVLILGTATTILLALGGNLIASWLSARTRLLSFAVLRALGTTPGQLASMLTWEQVIVYATSIVLGVGFGALLAGTIVPMLVFTGSPNYLSDTSSGEFYIRQHTLPTQIVVPGQLVLVFVALAVICALAIGLMTRIVSRPSPGQTLRLNAD